MHHVPLSRAGLVLTVALALVPAGTAGAAEVNVEAEGGLGYDSNAFRAPGEPYHDMAQAPDPAGDPADPASYPLVVPDEKSGLFVPLKLDASRSARANGEGLVMSYTFKGDLYLTGDTSNANNYDHDARLGYDLVLDREGKRANSAYLGAFVTSRNKVYTDRDTGQEKTTSTNADISNRFSYLGYGVEAEYDHHLGRVQYGADATVEIRDYSDPQAVSQYDYTSYRAGAYSRFRLADPTRLKLSLDYEIQDFSDRKARDLTASLTGNPTLTYDLLTFDATLRQKLAEFLTAYLGYTLKTRTDGFEGYNDYTSNGVDLRLLYRSGPIKAKLALGYATRSYDNAFAFENPNAPGKDYDTFDTKLSGEYAKTERLSLWGEVSYLDISSNDTRYAYSRYQAVAGARLTY